MKLTRRKSALQRLEAQFASGVKTAKKSMDQNVPLSDSDKERIKKEIQTLKGKV